MCASCEAGGFHKESLPDHSVLLQGTWHITERRKYLSDGVVQFYVKKESFPNKQAYRYTNQLIKEIDSITGIKIRRVKNKDKSDITVEAYETYENHPTMSRFHPGYAGLAYVSFGTSHATFLDKYLTLEPKINKKGKPFKKRKQLTDLAKRLITHEVLHTLGLSHPNDDGYDENFTNADTTMSYRYRSAWSGMTALDMAALQELYGFG